MNAYIINIAIMIEIFAVLAASLNLALGYSGLLNLGHVAFFGIGAYTSVLLVKTGVPFPVALIAAGLMTGIFGFALVFATRKLKSDYLALATLGFSFVIYSLMLNWQSLTNGPLGITGIARPEIFGITFGTTAAYFVLTTLICLCSILFMHLIVKSPFGRLIEAMRDDEVQARVLGKDTFKLKAKVMMTSAFFAGIAGSLFAHYLRYIDPTNFTLTEVILILSIVIVGGIASIKGSVLSTILLIIIPELMRFVAIPSNVLGPMRQVMYAVILIAILMLKPRGIFGRADLT